MSIQENKQVSFYLQGGILEGSDGPASPTRTGTTDPRILRSRRMLMDSLARLLMKKEFEDISVQEIADEATLNRATFYLHYPDKNALLQAMTGVRFRDLIEPRRSPLPTAREHCALLHSASATIWLTTQAVPSVGSETARRLHHSGRRGYVQGRPCPSWDCTRCRCGTAGDHRGLGRFWSRAPLVSDPGPYPRRGDGSED